jgi:chromosome segregation ATPase
MSKAAKQVIIILGVLLAVSIFVAFSTFSQKTAIEQTAAQLQGEVDGHKKNIAVLDQKQKELSEECDRIKQQAADVTKQKARLQEDVDSLSKKLKDFETRVGDISEERDELKDRYSKVSRERDDVIAKLQDTEKKLSEAQKKAEEMASVVAPTPAVIDDNKQLESHWAQVLKEKADLNLRIDKLENDLNQSAMDIEELKKKNSDLELEISALKQEREDLQQQIKRGQDIADNVSIDLVREKNDKQFVGTQLDKIKEENLALRAQVKELGSMKIVLEKSISKLQEDKLAIEKKLSQSETVIQDRLDDVLKLKEDINRKVLSDNKPQEVILPPIIVNGSGVSAEKPAGAASVNASGEIVSVNQENNFIIVDLGQNSGVSVGDRLSVYRGDAYLGEVEIIQVRADISAADIKKQSSPFQAGDIVK